MELYSKLAIDNYEVYPHAMALVADSKAYSQGLDIKFRHIYRDNNFVQIF